MSRSESGSILTLAALETSHKGALDDLSVIEVGLPSAEQRFNQLPWLAKMLMSGLASEGFPIDQFHIRKWQAFHRQNNVRYYENRLRQAIQKTPGEYRLLDAAFNIPAYITQPSSSNADLGQFTCSVETGLPNFPRATVYFDRLRSGRVQGDNLYTLRIEDNKKPPIIVLPVGTRIPIYRDYAVFNSERRELIGEMALPYAHNKAAMIEPGTDRSKMYLIK